MDFERFKQRKENGKEGVQVVLDESPEQFRDRAKKALLAEKPKSVHCQTLLASCLSITDSDPFKHRTAVWLDNEIARYCASVAKEVAPEASKAPAAPVAGDPKPKG